METRKAIKIATATAIAASAFTAVAPAQSEAAASLTSQIKTAKATIKKPYDTYYIEANDTKPASFTKVKNELAAAKKAKTNINAAIKKANLSTKQKNAYYAQIKAYDQYITRAQGYVNAVSINVRAARNELTEAVKMGKQSSVLSAQTALNKKTAEFEKAVAKVYGKYTRPLLTNNYATPAKKQAASVDTEMKVYTAYKQMESDKLVTTDLKKAGELIESVKDEVEKLQAKNTLLAANLLKAVDKNNALYETANYAETKKVVAAQVSAYVTLANGDLKTEAQVSAAKTAKAAIDLTVLKEVDQADLKAQMDAADVKVTAAEEALKMVQVESVSAITSTAFIGQEKQLQFAINGSSTAADVTALEAAGYTVKFLTTLGEMPAGKVTANADFSYRVEVSKDGTVVATSAEKTVKVGNVKPYITKVGAANLVVDGELVDFDAASGVAAEFAGTAFTLIDDQDTDPNTLTLTYDMNAPVGNLPSLTFNDKTKLSSIAVNGMKLDSDLLAMLIVKAVTTSVDSLDLDTILGGTGIASVAKTVSVTLENASGYTSTYTMKLEKAK